MHRLDVDVLIFDMDGVLVDVSESYRNAIRQTVQVYLEIVLGPARAVSELVSPSDVAAFKLAGGFNNDWDLTTGLLKYYFSLLDLPSPKPALPRSLADIVANLRQSGTDQERNWQNLFLRKDVSAFASAVQSAGGGLSAVDQILGNRNRVFLFASGNLRETNLVQRIFEEIYLGPEEFSRQYGEAPLVHREPGLIERERLIISPSTLADIRKHVALGIATGRPRNQALYALKATGIIECFRSLVAHEDIVAAEEKHLQETGEKISLGKPKAFPLLEAVRRITNGHPHCAYVGDTLDDVRAANAAKATMPFASIACLAPAENKAFMRQEFERVGADVIVSHPDDLAKIVGQA